MFIAEAWARPAKSGLNLAAVLFGRGSVAQAEAEKTAARVTRAIRDSSLLGGDFVSRMQVTVCKGFVTLPLRCAQCHNSNDSKSSYVLWRVVHRFFHSLRGKMFQSGFGGESLRFQVPSFKSLEMLKSARHNFRYQNLELETWNYSSSPSSHWAIIS
jgi:hypothetical protein